MKKINIGCNTIIIKDNKLLLGKRKNHFGEGTWGLPGGHLEFGENLIDAAKRELKEELGIVASDLKLISIVEGSKDGGKHYIQVNFLLDSGFEGEITNKEPEFCEVLEYFDLDGLPEIFPPHQNIIKAYKNNQIYWDGFDQA